MKVALITAQLGMGGAEKMVYQLARGLKEQGEEVTVIAAGGYYVDLLLESGIGLILLPLNDKKHLWHFQIKRKIIRELKNHYDIIHVHTIPLAIYIWIISRLNGLKIPIVLTMHGSSIWKLRLTGPVIKLLPMTRCAVSEELASLLKARHIPNPVEIDQLLPEAAKRLRKIKNENIIEVGIVARLVKEKGVDIWLKAVPLLLTQGIVTHTRLVGDGPERVQLEQMSAGYRKYITFCGVAQKPWKELADVDLIVSSSRREGEPLAILEAMASYKPIVATSVGGVSDLLKDGAGILVEPTPWGLVAGVKEYLAFDEEKRRNMIDAAYQKVRTRTWEHCIEAYQKIYKEAALGGERCSPRN